MNVIQFLLQHLDTILTLLSIVAVLVLGLVYITKNGRNFINAMLLSFVTIAEKEFGAGTGALKKSQVVTAVYERLPSIKASDAPTSAFKSHCSAKGIARDINSLRNCLSACIQILLIAFSPIKYDR